MTFDQPLGANSAAIADLASVLKHYQVATLSFSKGLEPKELVGFCNIGVN